MNHLLLYNLNSTFFCKAMIQKIADLILCILKNRRHNVGSDKTIATEILLGNLTSCRIFVIDNGFYGYMTFVSISSRKLNSDKVKETSYN